MNLLEIFDPMAAPRPIGIDLGSDSVTPNDALDADTGRLRWHFQFTPNDGYDYDSVQVPVLANISWKGAPTKVMLPSRASRLM